MPSTSPEMVEYGFAISPGTENYLALKPEVLHSVEDIQTISYLKRSCYMQSEKHLRYYRTYAYLNCFMECAANFTYEVS